MSTESNFMISILRECRVRDSSEYDRKLRELIKNPATVLTIFRCIDQYSQEFIQKIVRLSFHTSLDQSKQETILKRLLDENYPEVEFNKGRSDLAKYRLINFKEKGQNNGFINTYLDIITNGLTTNIDFYKQSKNQNQIKKLEDKAKQQWKQICNQLMIMAQSSAGSSQSTKFSPLVMDVFKQILIVEGKNGSGYQKYMEFILEDTNTQIDRILYWYCILFASKNKISGEASVNFLLTLSNLDITKIYQNTYSNETQNFTQWEQDFVNDLHSLGMIVSQQRKERVIFYITPVLWQFCYRKIDLKTLNAKITIETNFNVYAYIDQDDAPDQTDHIEKLLANFCDLHYKFPHLIVGQLSEFKTKTQFRNGLTARLLIQFFNKTSDPQMKKYLKDKQMNAIMLTQVQNLQKKKLEFLNLFKKTEENFSLIPDNIEQEIETWEREKFSKTERLDGYNSDDDVKEKDQQP